ncbi:MAG: pyridoxal phosphate-dependent aminotransferase [Oscillospiraceae bacterium]|nr:pyridoxal phosphate-dependent aminotransferase [Oscillospiraceae bacterium]
MTYDFDREIDRRGTLSIKWDFAREFGKPEGVLPLWVADMDFPAPDCVNAALRAAADHGIYGYSDVKEDYADAVIGWFSRFFGWKAEREWLVKTPGVVFAIANAVRAFTEAGDAVMITPPVYYPFKNVAEANGRRVIESELVIESGRYRMDFCDIERKIVDNNVKMFIFCSPHNPVGRVWTEDEIRTLGSICRSRGVFVVSDEIHCDFTLPGHTHRIFDSVCPENRERVMICTAPSKSFNLAGLGCSNIFIPDKSARESFERELSKNGFGGVNKMGLVAAQAAYTGGEEWLREVKTYMRANLDFLRDYLREYLPEVRLVEPEGTYFAWLDFSALGLSPKELDALVLNRAKLWLDAGSIFGECGGQYQRVVLACTRKTLAEALERLRRAVRG